MTRIRFPTAPTSPPTNARAAVRAAGRAVVLPIAAWIGAGCAGPGDDGGPERDPGRGDVPAASAGAALLGPVDGRDLPAADLDRIRVGMEAPDFALESYDGGVVRLSDYRGRKDVVLVFYRGHW